MTGRKSRAPHQEIVPVEPRAPLALPQYNREDYVLATIDNCTLDDWKMIVQRAVADAMGGNEKARRWLSEYILGDPKQNKTVDKQVTIKVEYAPTVAGSSDPPLEASFSEVDGEKI